MKVGEAMRISSEFQPKIPEHSLTLTCHINLVCVYVHVINTNIQYNTKEHTIQKNLPDNNFRSDTINILSTI